MYRSDLFYLGLWHYGCGLFAKQQIPVGTIIWTNMGDDYETITKEEFKRLPLVRINYIKKYGFINKAGLIIVPTTDLRFLNHSCNANILEDRKNDIDIVVRTIEKNEEATYDYRIFYDDSDIDDPENNWECQCGEPNCCKFITCIHPNPVLYAYWDDKIKKAKNVN